MNVYSLFLFILLLPSFTFAESADLVLIEKEARLLTLRHGDKELGRYTIALGGSSTGAKRCQGDKKTPEGEYHIASRNVESSFYKSLLVSYPNQTDRQKAAELKCNPGGDIMIHGLPKGIGWIGPLHQWVDWTAGCIAVTNSEMDKIWNMVPVGTRVQIKP